VLIYRERKGFLRTKKGQSLAEYVIVATLIALALAVMGPGFRRSIQKVVKGAADAIGFQHGAEQAAEPDKGFLNAMTSNAKTSTSGTEQQALNIYTATETQQTVMNSVTYTNGAFVNE
jgi:Flp pilus assembly pilin Flp